MPILFKVCPCDLLAVIPNDGWMGNCFRFMMKGNILLMGAVCVTSTILPTNVSTNQRKRSTNTGNKDTRRRNNG